MAANLGRRGFLRGAVTTGMAAAGSTLRSSTAAAIRRETFTYKTVGDCALKADVIRRDCANVCRSPSGSTAGALIMGDRRGIDRTLRDELVNAGHALVSIDYRLAPETKLSGSSTMSATPSAGSGRKGQKPSARGRNASPCWAARPAAT